MKWDDLAKEPCSVARSVAVIGDRWTLLILRDCFLGVRRFDAFQVRLGISRTIIAERLRLLTDEGVLMRVAYQENPTRFEYRLTEKGFDLYPVLVALNTWGSRYYADAVGSPLVFRHRDCGGEVRAELHCAEGHDVDDMREVVSAPGPGARRRAAS